MTTQQRRVFSASALHSSNSVFGDADGAEARERGAGLSNSVFAGKIRDTAAGERGRDGCRVRRVYAPKHRDSMERHSASSPSKIRAHAAAPALCRGEAAMMDWVRKGLGDNWPPGRHSQPQAPAGRGAEARDRRRPVGGAVSPCRADKRVARAVAAGDALPAERR